MFLIFPGSRGALWWVLIFTPQRRRLMSESYFSGRPSRWTKEEVTGLKLIPPREPVHFSTLILFYLQFSMQRFLCIHLCAAGRNKWIITHCDLLFFCPQRAGNAWDPCHSLDLFLLFFFVHVFLFGVISSATALANALHCLKQILWFHGDGDSFYHTVVDGACVHTYRYHPKN